MRALLLCLVLPATAFAQSELPSPVELFVGDQQVLVVPGLSRIAIGDTKIVDVQRVEKDQLLITGTGPGETHVIVWRTGNAARLEWKVHVAQVAGARATTTEEVVLRPGEEKTLQAPGVSRVSIGDDEISDVKAQGEGSVTLRARKSGVTTLMLWTQARRAIRVTVLP